jgi:microcystin-dependent protein
MVDISKIDMERINGLLDKLNTLLSPGDICYSLRTEKEGWLLCNGQAVSRTIYADLFAVISTKFGSGNGSTTFNVPNYSGKFLQMNTSKSIGDTIEAGLPNITGELTYYRNNAPNNNKGAFSESKAISENYAGNTSTNGLSVTPKFNASKSNSIYGKSNTVQPPASIVNYFIKY